MSTISERNCRTVNEPGAFDWRKAKLQRTLAGSDGAYPTPAADGMIARRQEYITR